jgi:leucyl aminopeptidase
MTIDFAYLKQPNKRKKADVLVLPFWKDKQTAQLAVSLEGEFSQLLSVVLATEDFKGKEGEILYLYVADQPEKRLCLLGLGTKSKATVECLRRCYGNVTRSCLSKRLKSVNLMIPQLEGLQDADLLRGMAEGLLLPNYIFNSLKHREAEESPESTLQTVTWIGPQQHVLDIVEKISSICEAVYITRDLVNGNADDITPQYLAQYAKSIVKKHPSIKTTVFDKKRIEKEKMGLLLAVNRGSALDPTFIIMEYKGNPHSHDHTVLVGKGVTYDTGGLNLKPTGGMETMKCDMAGAAACFGTLLATCLLKLKVNLTVVVPSTENCIDAKSFKPGDVYTSYLGKTVEMTNSDAEGRLILADGLAYAVKNLHPTRLIDLATLTGAIEIALGSEASGMMSTDDELALALLQSGEATFERLWRMPLYEEYKERLKSDIADMKSWNGRSAGANIAATFLRQFVEESLPWAHIDIAGTAYLAEAKRYWPKFATGFGVRLMIEFLEGLENQKDAPAAKARKRKAR